MSALPPDVEHRAALARRLALQAGAMALPQAGRSAVRLKGRHDEVTAMDAAVERFIRQALAQACPDDAVLGEEEGGGAPAAEAGAAAAEPDRWLWIVDPIDGTANYARGIPRWAVSIAATRRRSLAAGLIDIAALAEPALGRLYHAVRGQGAWLDEGGHTRRLAVSGCAQLAEATLELGWSTHRPAAEHLAQLAAVMAAGCAWRRAGSGALGLADVAAGRIEAYAELHLHAWDCAAGLLLVAEAGGRVSDFFDGRPLAQGRPVLATQARLADPLAALCGVPLRPPAPG